MSGQHNDIPGRIVDGRVLHSPFCSFLTPAGTGCDCGAFEREIAAAKLPRTTTTTEETAMGYDDPAHDYDDHPSLSQKALIDFAAGNQTTGQRAEAICSVAADLVNNDRNAVYGDAEVNFTETGALWAVVFGHEVTAEQVAICMALVKVARLIKTPNHADSWTDGVGYLALGGSIATKPGRYV